MIIGITGGTGSGKTTALEVIRSLGGTVLDCDAIYHQLLTRDPALLQAISRRFPGTVENGVLDRKALGSIVFSDPEALKDLNRITHAAVKAEVQRQLESKPKLAAIDAIALLEGGLGELCDVTVAVTAPETLRLQRLMARDGISEEYARSRIQAQKSQAWYQANCDYVLENTADPQSFQAECLAFFRQLGIMTLSE